MRKKGNIVSYSDDELAAMQARGEDRTDWASIKAKTEVPADWVSRAQAATGLMQRPKENKRQVTMRFDADVLEFFRRSGRGWQGRMNAVLRSFMERQGHWD